MSFKVIATKANVRKYATFQGMSQLQKCRACGTEQSYSYRECVKCHKELPRRLRKNYRGFDPIKELTRG